MVSEQLEMNGCQTTGRIGQVGSVRSGRSTNKTSPDNLFILTFKNMKKQVLLTAAVLSATSMMAQKLTYPQAPKDGTVDTYFGVQVADPYRPLENDSSKATAEWVAAENKVTQEYLSRIPFRGKLLKRMKELANYEKERTPSRN